MYVLHGFPEALWPSRCCGGAVPGLRVPRVKIGCTDRSAGQLGPSPHGTVHIVPGVLRLPDAVLRSSGHTDTADNVAGSHARSQRARPRPESGCPLMVPITVNAWPGWHTGSTCKPAVMQTCGCPAVKNGDPLAAIEMRGTSHSHARGGQIVRGSGVAAGCGQASRDLPQNASRCDDEAAHIR